MEITMPKCRFCGEPAVARYALSDGCLCYPNDREQELCAQHEYRSNPLGTMYQLEDYVVGRDNNERHDPLCILSNYTKGFQQQVTEFCQCALITKVRDDERERMAKALEVFEFIDGDEAAQIIRDEISR